MAKYVAIPSHIKLHVHGNCASNGYFVSSHSQVRMQRRCFIPSARVAQVSLLNSCKFSVLHVTNLKVNSCPSYNCTRCYCFGTLINTDGTSTSEWVPVVNQVLLMASIFLTYMAGVIPAKKVPLNPQNEILNDHALPGESRFSGSATEMDHELNSNLPWNIVEEKLMDALNAIEQAGNLGNRSIKFEREHAKQPLSLYAIADGPRFRLLWASFQWLKKEVDNISGKSTTISMTAWSSVFSEVIQKSCRPVCMAWLEKELCLKSSNPDKKLLSLMVEKLKGEDAIIQNIRNSGKEDLYADLAHFLAFGSPREGCCYSCSLFTMHGVAVLEDFVVTLADGIASMFLELISVDGGMSKEMDRLDLMPCTLSTRELQKLRNEVALNQWMHQNINTVVLMYEDRFDLCTLQRQVFEESGKGQAEKISWWKKLTLRKSGSVSSPLYFVLIDHVSINVKRTKELKALIGWRYYFSLFLELADITMPFIRTIFAEVRDAISFFLVSLIGRSLGLVCTGIRQSLRWK